MYCTHCGSKIEDGASFCSNCGAPVKDVKSDTKTEQEESKRETILNGENKTESQQTVQSKSKLAAGLLGIFLGSLGIHNFYLGYKGRALTQLLVSVLSCGFGATIMGIWGLVEGILYLTGSNGYTTDAAGVPLSE